MPAGMLGMLCLSIQTTKTRTGDVFRGLTRLVIYACRDQFASRKTKRFGTERPKPCPKLQV